MKLLSDVTVSVELPDAPACMVIDVGARVIVKSALVGTVRAKAWECMRLPLVPVIVIE